MKHELVGFLYKQPGAHLPDGLFQIDCGDFAAVLTKRRGSGFIQQWAKKDRLINAVNRLRLLESLMDYGPVLPVAPGTNVGKDDVTSIISSNSAFLKGLALRLDSVAQFQLTIHWAEDQVLKRFKDAPEIAPMFASNQVSAKVLQDSIARLAQTLRQRIFGLLSESCIEIAELPVRDDILSNHVVLVRDHETAKLDETLQCVDLIWPEGLRIRQIGPAPATSFASLTVKKYTMHDLDQARRCLDLPPGASMETIKTARKSALLSQPNKAAEVRHAARLMTATDTAVNTKNIFLLDTWGESQSSHTLNGAVA